MKKQIKDFYELTLDPLISEKGNLDWFIYDDESLNFLTNMDDLNEFSVEENKNIRFDLNNKIYFQDKLPEIILLKNEYKSFLYTVYISIDFQSSFEATLFTTGKEVINKLNKKFSSINQSMTFNEDEVIIKFKNIEEYIFELNEPLGKFKQIVDCLKYEKKIIFLIVPKPSFYEKKIILKGTKGKNTFRATDTNKSIELRSKKRGSYSIFSDDISRNECSHSENFSNMNLMSSAERRRNLTKDITKMNMKEIEEKNDMGNEKDNDNKDGEDKGEDKENDKDIDMDKDKDNDIDKDKDKDNNNNDENENEIMLDKQESDSNHPLYRFKSENFGRLGMKKPKKLDFGVEKIEEKEISREGSFALNNDIIEKVKNTDKDEKNKNKNKDHEVNNQNNEIENPKITNTKNYNIVSYKQNAFQEKIKNFNTFFQQKSEKDNTNGVHITQGGRISMIYDKKTTVNPNKILKEAHNNLDTIILNNILKSIKDIEVEEDRKWNENFDDCNHII